MKALELRIGNLTNLGRVYEIQQDKFYVMDENDSSLSSAWAEIEPIPLTEEWHVKFGANKVPMAFEYVINDYKYIVFIGDYVYLRDFSIDRFHPTIDDDVCTLWNKDIKKRDMYVHEWQNLYFALTQTELTHD